MSQPRQLKNAVNQVAGQVIGRDWSLYATLLDNWRDIVGQELAAHTMPVKIVLAGGTPGPRNKRENGTLHIKLPRGLAMEMQYKLHQVQARVNGFFGYDAITRIVLEHDNKPAKPPEQAQPEAALDAQEIERIEQAAAAIADPALREAAAAFGQAVAMQAKKQG
ncbi:MAG: DUF721 domain-containing protein [Alphaproteobacteria bacterium]|nr:DUF721 domain-containing protein [Alphaproteobacteria bacterium]